MNLQCVDRVVMLLSADWFAPFWERFGLLAGGDKREIIKLNAREEVCRAFNGENIYYNISFRRERLEMTANILSDLFAIADRPGALYDVAIAEPTDSSLLAQLNSLLSANDSFVTGVKLAPNLRQKVGELWLSAAMDETRYDEISEESDTSWDVWLRNATPDLPTSLADFLIVHVVTHARVHRFMASLRDKVDANGRAQLQQWYQNAAHDLTGEQFTLSIP